MPKKKCYECGSTRAALDIIKNDLGVPIRYRCIGRSACRKRQKELKEKKKELSGIVKQAVRRDRDYLVKENAAHVKENTLLKVRIAELEAVLVPIVRRSLRFALALKGSPSERLVNLSLRSETLKKAREVLSSGPKKFKDDQPDFPTIARHTIEDLGKNLLDITTLANEMEIAYESGYEFRRSVELGIQQG